VWAARCRHPGYFVHHPTFATHVSAPYLPPVDQLLALGRPEAGYREPWADYLAMGLSAGHVPELIRMATDAELAEGDPDTAEIYGGIHAWRALGQLRAEAAIEPLIGLVASDASDDDWVKEEVPEVLGMIGPAAFQPLRAALAEWSLQRDAWVSGAAARGLVEIASHFPGSRDAAVAALTRQLRWWGRQRRTLNSLLVDDLLRLAAVDAAPVMEEAFAAGVVDTWFTGDWEDVQVALGLLLERITPKPVYVPPMRLRPSPTIRIVPPAGASGSKRRPKSRKKARPRSRKRR
jgi:hypothetical protein